MDGRTLCFTGHREHKIPWCADPTTKMCSELRNKLNIILEALIIEGYENFISGMATGADTLCAAVILSLKKSKYENIKLHCYLPFREHYMPWNKRQIDTYKRILERADTIQIISERIAKNDAFFIRNEKMVDDSDYVIGIYNNTSGGTNNTLNYAAENNKKILVINSDTLFVSKYNNAMFHVEQSF